MIEGEDVIKFELVQIVVVCNLYFYYCDVENIVNVVFDEIIDVLVGGNCVELCGFGVFFVKNCFLCFGCNLCIGDVVFVEEKWVLFFKIGKELCECFNFGQVDEDD